MYFLQSTFLDGSRNPAISKMKLFMTIIDGLQPLTFVIKSSIVDAAASLDSLLTLCVYLYTFDTFTLDSSTSKSCFKHIILCYSIDICSSQICTAVHVSCLTNLFCFRFIQSINCGKSFAQIGKVDIKFQSFLLP